MVEGRDKRANVSPVVGEFATEEELGFVWKWKRESQQYSPFGPWSLHLSSTSLGSIAQ